MADMPTPPVIGEAPLASAPSRPALIEAEVNLAELAIGPKAGRPDYVSIISSADAVALRDLIAALRTRSVALESRLATAESSLQSERLARFLRVMVEDFALVEKHDERRGAPPTDIYRMPYSSSWFPTRAAAVDDFLARALAAPHPETRHE